MLTFPPEVTPPLRTALLWLLWLCPAMPAAPPGCWNHSVATASPHGPTDRPLHPTRLLRPHSHSSSRPPRCGLLWWAAFCPLRNARQAGRVRQEGERCGSASALPQPRTFQLSILPLPCALSSAALPGTLRTCFLKRLLFGVFVFLVCFTPRGVGWRLS